jgi:hypothetical protein
MSSLALTAVLLTLFSVVALVVGALMSSIIVVTGAGVIALTGTTAAVLSLRED